MSNLCLQCGQALANSNERCPRCNKDSPKLDLEITQVITNTDIASTDVAIENIKSLSHFQILSVIRGGNASIFKAKDPILERDIALKIVPPKESQNALIQEAKLACKLNHPNIVTIHEISEADTQSAIVMEWVDGLVLNEYLSQNSLSLLEKVELAIQLCQAIDYAHQHQIVHRDITPRNIMVNQHGQIKVLDFGLSKLFSQDERQNALMGTPAYIAPEVYLGSPANIASDLFSLGTLLYLLLSEQNAFSAQSIAEYKVQITKQQPTPLDEITEYTPAALQHVIEGLLSKNPDQRPPLSQVIDVLNTIKNQLSQQPNWWQKRTKLQQTSLVLICLVIFASLLKPIVLPPSTEQVIQAHIVENKRIAVLPFQNISDDPQIRLFSQGLAVTLSNELGKVGRQEQASWIVPSSEIAKVNDLSHSEIHKRFGVDIIVAGSIQHLGSKRLINITLIDGATGLQLNQAQFNVSAKQLFQATEIIFEQALTLLNWPSRQISLQSTQFDGAYRSYINAIGYLFRSDQQDYVDTALDSFKQAILLEPNYIDAHIGLAHSYLRKYQQTKDIIWLAQLDDTTKTIEKIVPKHSQLDYFKAVSLIRRGQASNALPLLNQAIASFPNQEHSYFELAKAYEQLQQPTNAEQSYLSGLKIVPNYWRGLAQLGRFYFKSGNYRKAVATYQRMTEITPLNYITYVGLTASYYAQGEMEQALQYSKKANEIRPTAIGYSNLGTLQFYLKDYTGAIESYRAAIAINNEKYLTWGNLGDAYFASNNPKAADAYSTAITHAKKAVALNSLDSEAIAHLAYYLARNNQPQQALNYIKQINNEHNNTEHYLIALSYDALGMVDDAYQSLNTAIEKGYSKEEAAKTPLWINLSSHAKFASLTENP